MNPDTWAQQARQHIHRTLDHPSTYTGDAFTILEFADWIERRQLLPAHQLTANILGFGTVDVIATETKTQGWWTLLDDLTEPLALPLAALEALAFNDLTQGGHHTDRLHTAVAPHRYEIVVADAHFALETLITASPWRHEAITNISKGRFTDGPGAALGGSAPAS